MLAKIIGLFAAPAGGLIWDSGTIEFVFDSSWSNGNARALSPIRGILHPTLKNRFVAPVSLGDLFVPATPTGAGVEPGPAVIMRYEMFSSDGQRYRDQVNFSALLANASGEWNVNQQAVNLGFVTSPGPDPVGLTVGAGDARYVLRTDVIAAAQIGAHASRHGPGGADAIGQLGNFVLAALSGNSGINMGRSGSSDTPFFNWRSSGLAPAFDSQFTATGGTATNGQGNIDFTCALFRINSSPALTVASNNVVDIPTTAPAITWASGVGSAANLGTQTVTYAAVDAKEILCKISVPFTAAGQAQFGIAPPSAGFTIVGVQFGACKPTGGVQPTFGLPLDSIIANFPDAACSLTALVRLRRTA